MAIATHFDRYKELQEEYKICRSTYGLVPPEIRWTNDDKKIEEAYQKNLAKFDAVIEYIGSGYAHKKYRVVKNGPGLSTEDLAIICDGGNLCFGYRTEGGIICVYTD